MNPTMRLISWLPPGGEDLIAVILSIAMVAAYYIYLRRRTKRDQTYSIHTVNALTRRVWVMNIMANKGYEIMAVQTLRNYIMVSIMMASTAALLIMGTLTLSSHADSIVHSWHGMGLYGSHSPGLWIFKVFCLLLDFITAFFSYAMSMRLATHVLFMINVPQDAYREHPQLSPEFVANRLVQSGNMFAVGMRAFFFAIPLVFWLFGAVFLVLASVGLVITLYRLDRHESGAV